MDFNVMVRCWLVFWGTYWISGIYLTWKQHFSGVRRVIKLKEVILNLLSNMFWSFLAMDILQIIPFRLMTEYNIVTKLVLNYLITDIYFYHVHILLHQPQFYKLFHKVHHSLVSPFALSAMYSGWYECIFLNTFAGSLGILILEIPSPYLYIWYCLIALNTTISHSGMTIRYLIDDFHDHHHKYFHYNYGLSHYFDSFYQTNYSLSCNIYTSHLGNFNIDTSSLESCF